MLPRKPRPASGSGSGSGSGSASRAPSTLPERRNKPLQASKTKPRLVCSLSLPVQLGLSKLCGPFLQDEMDGASLRGLRLGRRFSFCFI